MKNLITALLMLLSFGANAQRTNESEYVITEWKLLKKAFHTDAYTDGQSRLIIYTENGKQHLEIYDRCCWTFKGIIEDNDLPVEEVQASATKYRSKLYHKTWKYETSMKGEILPLNMIEISFIVSYQPQKTLMYMSEFETGFEWSGYRIK